MLLLYNCGMAEKCILGVGAQTVWYTVLHVVGYQRRLDTIEALDSRSRSLSVYAVWGRGHCILIYSFSANMCLGTITVSFVLAAFSRPVSRVASCECCADTSWGNCVSLVENQLECLVGSSRNGKDCIVPRVPQGWRGLSRFLETTRQVLSNDITFIVLKQLLCEKRVSYEIPIHKIWSHELSCDCVQPPLITKLVVIIMSFSYVTSCKTCGQHH